MKRITKTIVTVMVMSSLVATPAFAAPAVDELQIKKSQAENAVSNLQSELKQVISKMNDLEKRMADKGEAIDKTNAELALAQEKEAQQYDNMKLRIKYMYEEGDSSFLESIITSKSITEMLNKAEYVSAVHGQDRKMLVEYVNTKQEVATMKSTLETEMEELQELGSDFHTQKESLGVTIESKSAEIANFDQELQVAVAAAAAEVLAKEAAEKEAKNAEAQANNNSNGGNSNTGNNSGNTGNNSGNTGNNSGNTGNTGGGSSNNTPTPTPPPIVGNASLGAAIVNGAEAYLGVPYVYGGNGFNGIDCSGLTQQAHRAAGISIGRTSYAQEASGQNVGSLANALPGDIVCYPGHVAIYVGGGQVIHAPTEGQVVKYANVSMGPWQPITSIRRYW